jgi:HlyD family secretion protein
MKILIRIALTLLILTAIGASTYPSLSKYYRTHKASPFRQENVTRGSITSVVNSTGTVQPMRSVQIGSFVSGPIIESNVDFNSNVTKDQLLARIDPRIYEANVARDTASVAHAQADVSRVKTLLHQARRDEKRSQNLRATNRDYIADTEMDQFRFARSSLEAQLELAEAAVLQAKATLALSQQNLDYTQIKSPVDGIVIDRKIDPGHPSTRPILD